MRYCRHLHVQKDNGVKVVLLKALWATNLNSSCAARLVA